MNTDFHPGRRVQTSVKNYTGNPTKPHNWEVWGNINGADTLLGTGKTLADAESAAITTVATKHKGYHI